MCVKCNRLWCDQRMNRRTEIIHCHKELDKLLFVKLWLHLAKIQYGLNSEVLYDNYNSITSGPSLRKALPSCTSCGNTGSTTCPCWGWSTSTAPSSIPTSSITICYVAATAKAEGRLQRIALSAQRGTGCSLQSRQDFCASRTLRQVNTDPSNHFHKLFEKSPPPAGGCSSSVKVKQKVNIIYSIK